MRSLRNMPRIKTPKNDGLEKAKSITITQWDDTHNEWRYLWTDDIWQGWTGPGKPRDQKIKRAIGFSEEAQDENNFAIH